MEKKKKKFIKPTVKLCDFDDIETILAGSDESTLFSFRDGTSPSKDRGTTGSDGSGGTATWFPGGF